MCTVTLICTTDLVETTDTEKTQTLDRNQGGSKMQPGGGCYGRRLRVWSFKQGIDSCTFRCWVTHLM